MMVGPRFAWIASLSLAMSDVSRGEPDRFGLGDALAASLSGTACETQLNVTHILT